MAAMDLPKLRGRDIVCVGFADWETELWTNQHHLMSRLADDNRVLFVESLGLRQPQLARRDLARIARRLRRGLSPPRTLNGVHVLSPLVLPLHRYRIARALNRLLLPRLVKRAARRLGFNEPILWGYVPQAEMLRAVLKPSLTIYHCVDDIAAQDGIDTESFHTSERRYASHASLVLASSPALTRRMRKLSSNVLEARNVADTALFATAIEDGPIDPAIAELPKPRIVFTGAIVAIKLDFPSSWRSPANDRDSRLRWLARLAWVILIRTCLSSSASRTSTFSARGRTVTCPMSYEPRMSVSSPMCAASSLRASSR